MSLYEIYAPAYVMLALDDRDVTSRSLASAHGCESGLKHPHVTVRDCNPAYVTLALDDYGFTSRSNHSGS